MRPPGPPAPTEFEVHAGRGRFNAAFFSLMGPYLEWNLRTHKRRVFADLPDHGRRARFRGGRQPRLPPARATLVAIEPNPHMHRRLRAAAERAGVHLDLHERVAERTGLPDHSVDTVISSLVLCSVADPAAVLAEVRRILRPGGTLSVRRARRGAGLAPRPAPCSGCPPTVGVDVRGVLVRAGPGGRDPRRRVRRRERRAVPAPHPVHPVQHAHRRHRPRLISDG